MLFALPTTTSDLNPKRRQILSPPYSSHKNEAKWFSSILHETQGRVSKRNQGKPLTLIQQVYVTVLLFMSFVIGVSCYYKGVRDLK